MYIVCVTVKVKPEFVEPFIAASLLNQRGSRHEPGNVRWDFLQSTEDPGHFILYEVYTNADEFGHHQKTEHFLTWRTAVADWLVEPRTRVILENIAPTDDDWYD